MMMLCGYAASLQVRSHSNIASTDLCHIVRREKKATLRGLSPQRKIPGAIDKRNEEKGPHRKHLKKKKEQLVLIVEFQFKQDEFCK